ncbi:P-loop ATPase, Sll1717 family [Steroidobacter sp.]|uniref:P-loop ATPase, Sll1717 family n=1 Tax=Steroidobacter sp. TaxID=1978227 RepID=UPI001A4B73EB|nr:hypothetical protein [Steroidobacter sp.]MBL8268587.1 hypothetical protein [Steroidobacter sp.]
MKINLDDRSLFGNDAGEDEDEDVLMSYFVNHYNFKQFLDPSQRMHIARGRKGTGKSALLVRFAHERRTDPKGQPAIVVHRTPASLVALKQPPVTEDPITLQNYWVQAICGAINMQLARDIGFAWRDDQIALIENAELAGYKGRNVVSSLLSRIVAKINLGGFIELSSAPRQPGDQEQLLQRLRHEAELRRPVWFLMDDIDTMFENTRAQRNSIAAFFAACRELSHSKSGIGIRATVRTDVWALLGIAEYQDKVDQYSIAMTWSASQQRDLLTHRVLAYIQREYPGNPMASWSVAEHGDQLIDQVFVQPMKWRNDAVPATHVVRVLAGGRPRWITQLCRMAGDNAAMKGEQRIALHHIKQAMPVFGQRRLSDLYREHQYQFADLRALIESFAAGPRNYTTDQLLERLGTGYLKRTPVERIPMVDGTPFTGPMQLARFLFMIGFFNGHNADYRGRAVPEFVSFEERPDLLQVETNRDDGMTWEVLPAYRNVLHI